MTRAEVWLRRFLLKLVAVVCAGTIVELLLIEHTGNWIQVIPVVVAAAGMVASILGLARPEPSHLARRAFRAVFALLVLAGFVGVYQHVRANYTFIREIQPNLAPSQAFLDSLAGASPLLASGVLVLAGVCGLAAIRKL